jgi:hypothetical protein
VAAWPLAGRAQPSAMLVVGARIACAQCHAKREA